MIKDIRRNPLMLTDAYNLSHQRLKENTDWEGSHLYNRKTSMILYGFQEIVTDLLSTKITMEMIDEADERAKFMGLQFPRELFERVVTGCGGNIPLKVEILQEGTWCPTGTPFAQVRNTEVGFGELVTWWEGVMMHSYFASACATRALEMRRYLETTRDRFGFDDSFLLRFHSFGFRGHKSLEDAYWAGTAWNLFMKGSDDFHISSHVREIEVGSIAALAHKVTQQYDDEYKCFTHTIDSTAEAGEHVVAMVIDTYDAWNVIENWVSPLAKYAKEKGVHLVFRPDSGDIFDQSVEIYRISKRDELSNVGVIIGEGMSLENAKLFDEKYIEAGVPLNFVSYGIGAGYYKDIERDTLGWAMKTCYSNGKPRMKVVKTNPFKQSIPNFIHLGYVSGSLTVFDDDDFGSYETIYLYTKGMKQPHIKSVDGSHYKKVSDRALEQDTSQKRVKYSEETMRRIAEFKTTV